MVKNSHDHSFWKWTTKPTFFNLGLPSVGYQSDFKAAVSTILLGIAFIFFGSRMICQIHEEQLQSKNSGDKPAVAKSRLTLITTQTRFWPSLVSANIFFSVLQLKTLHRLYDLIKHLKAISVERYKCLEFNLRCFLYAFFLLFVTLIFKMF